MGSGKVISPQNAALQTGDYREMNRRILSSSTETAPALDDDNLLAEFLLRLPRALVCKRWLRLVSEPHFLRRFRSHHQKAPLLGFIYDDFSSWSIGFISTLDSPDRIPNPHFSLQLGEYGTILDCHHGLVLVLNRRKEHVHVWDPVTRDHRYVVLSPAFNDIKMVEMGGVVLCTAKDQGHVHGACHSDPFGCLSMREQGMVLHQRLFFRYWGLEQYHLIAMAAAKYEGFFSKLFWHLDWEFCLLAAYHGKS